MRRNNKSMAGFLGKGGGGTGVQIQNMLSMLMPAGMAGMPPNALGSGLGAQLSARPGSIPASPNLQGNAQLPGFPGKAGVGGGLVQDGAMASDVDPTTYWVYFLLWYLFSQFVANNTDNTITLRRSPTALIVADNLRSNWWLIFANGAICWLAVTFVVFYLQYAVYSDNTTIAGMLNNLSM